MPCFGLGQGPTAFRTHCSESKAAFVQGDDRHESGHHFYTVGDNRGEDPKVSMFTAMAVAKHDVTRNSYAPQVWRDDNLKKRFNKF